MAVSLGDTLSGPNGFSRIPSSSYLSCCSSCALNSSRPSSASALCWYDVMSNRRCLESVEPRPEVAVTLRPEDPSLRLSSAARKVCAVHLSLVSDRLMDGGVAEHAPRADDALPSENKGSSDEASGNSAILSIRGEFTETSGDVSCSRMLMLRLGVSNAGNGSDALRAG
jgi:hypothetical protein